jgi:lysophospholipase L1-like esterase
LPLASGQRSLYRWLTRSALLFLTAIALILAIARPSSLRRWIVHQRQPVASTAEGWEKEIAEFEAADRVSPPQPGGVVFVGSSSIRLWPHLEADFPEASVLKRGFGGSKLSDVVQYAPRIVLPYHPRLIVLYEGDNDLAENKSPETVFREFQAFVALVHEALPETRIAFIAVKPSPARWARVAMIRTVNAWVRRYATTDPCVLYVDVFTPMLGPDGLPRRELFVADQLHLNARGYALWRELLMPIVRAHVP